MYYVSILCVLLAVLCVLLSFRLHKIERKMKSSFSVSKSVSIDGLGPVVPDNKTLKRLKSNVGYAVIAKMKDKIKAELGGGKTTYSITLLITPEDED